MKTYELLVIFKEEVSGSRIKDLLAEIGGEVLGEDSWGMRRLAYPINNCSSGFYVIYKAKMESGHVAGFKKKLSLEDNILRSMLFKFEENIV
jgi:small subunit ribosomal protein S6